MLKFKVEIDESNIYLDNFHDFISNLLYPYQNIKQNIIMAIFLFTLYPAIIIIALVFALLHYLFLGIYKIFTFIYEITTEYIFEYPDVDHLNKAIRITIFILLLPFRLMILIFGYTFVSAVAIVSYIILRITSIFMFIITSIGNI